MKAEQLRKSILQLAIQGKLVPQDPNDEPASVLLKRIRAEKQRLIKEGKIKKDKGDSVIFKGTDNCYYEKVGSVVKNIDDEIPFEIPDSWCWCKINDIIKINGGYAFQSSNYTTKEKGIRILRISDFDENGFNKKRVVYYKYNHKLEPFRLEVNDIIMCMTGGTVGKSFFVDNLPEDMLVNQRVADIKVNKFICPKYISLFLKSVWIKKLIFKAKNSTNDNISISLLLSFLTPIPPLAEQERIVFAIEKFEPLIAEYDKLEQQATKLDNEIYDKLKKSILQYAIQGKLVPQDPNDEPASELLKRIRAEKKAKLGKKYIDSYIYKGADNCYYEHIGSKNINITEEIPFEIPDSWLWTRFSNIINFILGKTPNRHEDKYWNKGIYPWFSIADMQDKKIIKFAKEKISEIALKAKFNNIFSPKGTLIMSFKLTVGRTSILGVDAVHNEAIISIFPYADKNFITRNFLMNTLGLLVKFVNQTDAIKGSTLNSDKLKKMFVPLPPLAEQERIVNKINEIFFKL